VSFAIETLVQRVLLTRHPKPTQPSIPPGSVNEYQLRLGRQRQVWFIPLLMNSGCAGKTVRSLKNACHTWAP